MTLKPLVVPQPVYAGTWAPATTPQVVKLHRTRDQFIADYGVRWKAGYRLSALIAHAMGGKVFYSGAWDPSTSGQFLGLARTHDQFLSEYKKWWGKGFRLIALASRVVDGTVYYSGVYNPSTVGQFVGLVKGAFIRIQPLTWAGPQSAAIQVGPRTLRGVGTAGHSGPSERAKPEHPPLNSHGPSQGSEARPITGSFGERGTGMPGLLLPSGHSQTCCSEM